LLNDLVEGIEEGRSDDVEMDVLIDVCLIYKFYDKYQIYIIIWWNSPYTNGTNH